MLGSIGNIVDQVLQQLLKVLHFLVEQLELVLDLLVLNLLVAAHAHIICTIYAIG